MKKILIILSLSFLISCGNKKLTYKKIETKNYILEGYTYANFSDKIFPNNLVLINKNTNDTIYKCQNCYSDFHLILEDTLLIYGGLKLDSIIDNKIILKRIPVSQDYKYNIPW
jgi:hypothetical protein